MKKQHYMLMDISNSFTKYAVTDGIRLGSIRRHPTPELTLRSLRQWDRQFNQLPWVVCGVVPSQCALVKKAFGSRAHFVTGTADLGLKIDYPNPSKIGPDRLANAIAATHYWKGPLIVLDFGTAVTFDVINKQSAYIGGVIAPGLNLMTDYLHEKTALLPRVMVHQPKSAIGKSTEDAMCSGAVYGYRGLVRGILKEIQEELGNPKRLPVIATGGQAEIVCRPMKEIKEINYGLTLEGLRIVGQYWKV